MSAKTEASYDEFPYPGAAFWFTHPDHLSVLAELHGMAPADPKTCRVLELGCGDGKNIVSLAAALPGATCVGVDLSAQQVKKAQELVAAAGVENCRIVQADVRDIGADFGTFDYVISHGVYSWIPDFAREGLLAAIGATLAPHGVAMVSYNAFPGWHDVAPVRRFLKFHTDPIKSVEGRVRQARSIADVFCGALADLDFEAFDDIAQKIRANVHGMSDWLLRHDWLADNHFPTYFTDFVAHARRHGLDYLTNAAPGGQNAEVLDADTRALVKAVPNRVRQQQYIDFFAHTRFRTTVLRRAETPISDEPITARILGLAIESRLEPEAVEAAEDKGKDKAEGEEKLVPTRRKVDPETAFSEGATAGPEWLTRFEATPEQESVIERDNLKYKVVTRAIAKYAPGWVTLQRLFDDVLADLVAQRLDDGYGDSESGRAEIRLALCDEIAWHYSRELVHLWRYPPAVATQVPVGDEKPRTGKLQRVLAAARDWVTTLAHRHAPLEPLEQKLLQRLDGTVSVDQLTAELGDGVPAAMAKLVEKLFVLAPDVER